MPTDIDALPLIPIPLSSGPWPTFSISLKERQALSVGKHLYAELEERQTMRAGELPQAELGVMSPPPITRSSEPEAVYLIASIPAPLLPILTPATLLERPAPTPFPSTSGSPHRILSSIVD
jgi:hypothetical protein